MPAVSGNQTVTVSYTKPATNPLRGDGGAEVDAFTDQAVTNATPGELVGNSGQADGSGIVFGSDLAQAFTTGGNDFGYKMTSVQIVVAAGGSLPGHEMKIMNDNGSGAPGTTTVGTLNSPTSLSVGLNEFTGDVDLASDTTY